MVVAILITALAGAAWRRWLGGWHGPVNWARGTRLEPLLWDGKGHRRAPVMAAGVLLTWPLWLVLPWWQAAIAAGLSLAFWTKGPNFAHWSVVLRYPAIGVAYPLADRFWPRAWIGPPGSLLDDWTAPPELASGGFLWGLLAAVCGVFFV